MLVIALLVSDIQVAIVMAALVGACVGFMPYNLNPAKMFMGDTGATFLGYILATMSIQGLFKFYAIISFAVPFLILGLPIFDTAFAFIRRIAHGQSPMHADRSHVHHRLIDMGLNQKQAVATLYVISAILGLSAVVLTTSGELQGHAVAAWRCASWAVVAARVVFPKEIKEELHEEMEELQGARSSQRNDRGAQARGTGQDRCQKHEEDEMDKLRDYERVRHPAGGDQDGAAGEGAGGAGRRSRAICCVTAQHRQMLDSVLEVFHREAGLGSGHHDPPADPVHHHQQVPHWAWTRPSTP